MAILHQVDKGKLALDQKADLLPNTWSPLRDEYPNDEIQILLSQLLSYTVSKSDNNGCDILFRFMGGTKKVHQYIYYKYVDSKQTAQKVERKDFEKAHREHWHIEEFNRAVKQPCNADFF